MTSTTAQSDHMPFLDGLRAVAVGSVIFYHVGLLRGGFVGVDVFFVISGFLILGQISSGLTNSTFSFADFWARRALRILPPYLLVILACALVSPFFLLLSSDYTELANEVVASALMNANHLFLFQQGYFDQSAQTKVLLHLWSLSVEEQFYVFAPVLAIYCGG